MTKEELNIQKQVGKSNPFSVPEGYFEQLQEQLMESLPEKQPHEKEWLEPTWWQKVRPLVYLAAMFVGAALIMRVATVNLVPGAQTAMPDEQEDEMQYIANVIDESMIDDYSLYLYLTDEEQEREP